jgi:hypothetical protein
MDAPELSSIATALIAVLRAVHFHQSLLAALYHPALPTLEI